MNPGDRVRVTDEYPDGYGHRGRFGTVIASMTPLTHGWEVYTPALLDGDDEDRWGLFAPGELELADA